MTDRKLAILLVVSILLGGALLTFVLDSIGVISASDHFSFLREKNPPKMHDADYPSEVDKLAFEKRNEKLIEKEEELLQQEARLNDLQNEIAIREKEIDELKKNILEERERLKMLTNDWLDRQKKIEDLAGKVMNMPPEKAIEMMENWRDSDVIEVMRQIDTFAETEGVPSITPYLLTLFGPERRAEVTRKMLLPPLEQAQ